MLDGDTRLKAYKFVAYSAVSFSVVAVLAVCVTLPMAHNYVKHVRAHMRHEIKYCKGSTKDIWSEVGYLKQLPNDPPVAFGIHNRTGRQADQYGAAIPSVSCDGCCLPGPPGTAGPSGKPGNPGKPGTPGKKTLKN